MQDASMTLHDHSLICLIGRLGAEHILETGFGIRLTFINGFTKGKCRLTRPKPRQVAQVVEMPRKKRKGPEGPISWRTTPAREGAGA